MHGEAPTHKTTVVHESIVQSVTGLQVTAKSNQRPLDMTDDCLCYFLFLYFLERAAAVFDRI
jgi:hypothetical protein